MALPQPTTSSTASASAGGRPGAWREFISHSKPLSSGSSTANNPSSSGISTPPIFSTFSLTNLRSRPLRSLILIIISLVSLGFIFSSSSSGGSGNGLRERWKGAKGWGWSMGGSSQSSSWIPSFTGFGGKTEGRYHLPLVYPPDSQAGGLPGSLTAGGDSRHDGAAAAAPGDGAGTTTSDGLIEPEFELDKNTGLYYPPDINPYKMNHFKRAKACFVSLVRNGEIGSIRESMRSVEDRFNRKAGYPWVFLNDEPFTDAFRDGVKQMTRSEVFFGVIPKEHWSYPSWIDQEKAAEERKKMEAERVIYGGSESYRHMCRFNSGFFFQHELLQQFDYYWRVEPGVEFFCDVDYDPFLFMEANNKSYGFTITIYEYERTIVSLWDSVREFVKEHPEHLAKDNAMHFIVDDMSKGINDRYNLCHFWSNFEIADMRFWRSKAYMDFFEFLDSKGGFFYERWGDAPVHSIAASLFLPASALHQFDDIAYRHNPYTHCPANVAKYHDNGKCWCNKDDSFDTNGYSCMRQWWRVGKRPDK